LEVIGDPPHLTAHSDIEELIPVSELFMPRTSVVNTAEPDAGRDWETRSVREEVWNRGVCNGERIKRIGNWHTDAGGTKECIGAWILKWVRRKRHRCERRIEVGTRIFKIAKYRQVFVAKIPGERPVVHLPVSWRQRRRESREVKQEVVATALIISAELVKLYYRIVDTRCAGIGIRVNNLN